MNKDIQNPYTTTGTKVVYQTPWILVREDEVIHPDGQPGIYSVVELSKIVIILPIDEQGNICMVRVWRYPLEQFGWELPAGIVDPDEDPLQCAKRELLEETGLEASHWFQVGSFFSLNGIARCPASAFVAQSLKQTGQQLDPDIASTQVFPQDKVWSLIQRGEVHQGDTLATLLLGFRYFKGNLKE